MEGNGRNKVKGRRCSLVDGTRVRIGYLRDIVVVCNAEGKGHTLGDLLACWYGTGKIGRIKKNECCKTGGLELLLDPGRTATLTSDDAT